MLALWDYHGSSPSPPDSGSIADAKKLTGWPRIEREGMRVRLPTKDMALDLGGIGKEYAVDKVAKLAEDAGIRDLLINFGHDLRVAGKPPQGGPWSVGLENPTKPGECWCGLALECGSVCTSGNYLRYTEMDGKRYGHILDPRTGSPVENECLAVTVVAQSCTEAGILSTAAFILGPDAGHQLLTRQFGVEGAIYTKHDIFQTGGFQHHVA